MKKDKEMYNRNIDLYIYWLKARFKMNTAEEYWIRQAIKGYSKDEIVRESLNKTIKK